MESKYEIIIYWSSNDSCFIAEVPELAGCMADGKDYNEVIQNVLVVIDEWIDTARLTKRVVPEPKGKLMFA